MVEEREWQATLWITNTTASEQTLELIMSRSRSLVSHVSAEPSAFSVTGQKYVISHQATSRHLPESLKQCSTKKCCSNFSCHDLNFRSQKQYSWPTSHINGFNVYQSFAEIQRVIVLLCCAVNFMFGFFERHLMTSPYANEMLYSIDQYSLLTIVGSSPKLW